MPQTSRDLMTTHPVSLDAQTLLVDAARQMADNGIGDVLVCDGDHLRGIVTDRDIVVRAVAEGRDLNSVTLGDVCTSDLVTLAPSDSVDAAIRLMGDHAIRRIPVVEGDRPVGIVAIGDLAIDLEPGSALGEISAAAPDQ